MDKKFIGLAAVMVVACFGLISAALLNLENGDTGTDSAHSFNAAYVDEIFDKNQVSEINISLAEADFNDMMQNPTQEEYKEAAITVNGEKVDKVGFRVKGNSSLSSVARSNSQRFSFKVDMDQYIDGQNLAGLTKLNLNNSFSDSSYMREYLSYALLEEMGIPTPAYSYANVYVNGELIGLYLAVEGIEEPFLERYYGNNYGNLYKPEGQGSDLVYVDDNMSSYSGIAAAIDLENGADEALLDMLKALNQGEDLEKYLDVDEILRYFAVNTVLVNMDSYLGSFKHNYYLYEENGVFAILPWDYNMSFGGFGMGGGNNQKSTSLYIDQPVSGSTLDQRPLLGKMLEVPEYKELYHQYIEDFASGPFAAEKMNAEIARVADMIRPHLENDPTKFSTMEQFEQAIAEGASAQNQETASSAAADVPAVRPTMPGMDGQVQPGQNNAAGQGRQGGMMQGNSNTGLVKFVRERVENIQKQLSGELPTAGDSAAQFGDDMTRMQPGNLENRPLPPDGMQPPDGMNGADPNIERQGRAGFNGGQGKMPGGDMDNRVENRVQNISVQQLYLIGESILLLIGTLLVIMKRRTKHSV